MTEHKAEVDQGQRFEFGKNWASFLTVVDEGRIIEAECSLTDMLNLARLDGKTFLDVGSGSGLFSLAAHRLGAQVHSFDYDPQSVATTAELRRRFGRHASNWKVETGSVLDEKYLCDLGQFDIVYSWGVLHHTGNMWQAMANVVPLIAPGGLLFIAIYNDQGLISRVWRCIKRLYCSGAAGRLLITSVFVPIFALTGFLKDAVELRNPIHRYSKYRRSRGMSIVHDWVDWLGGYPYETATPNEVVAFYGKYALTAVRQRVRNTLGCNEFVFVQCTPNQAAHGLPTKDTKLK